MKDWEKEFDNKFPNELDYIAGNLEDNGGFFEEDVTWKKTIPRPDDIKEFIEEAISQAKKEERQKFIDALPEEKHCELCEFPQPECSCSGVNWCINKIKKNLNIKEDIKLYKHRKKIKLQEELDKYSYWLHKEGYLDTDYYCEEPKAVEEYLRVKKS
ncbi:MAG: hypothetical protein OEV44_11100 [Spirochaetota bacterium]|nr:hypothetical protein [Spirochaetota bacterium]